MKEAKGILKLLQDKENISISQGKEKKIEEDARGSWRWEGWIKEKTTKWEEKYNRTIDKADKYNTLKEKYGQIMRDFHESTEKDTLMIKWRPKVNESIKGLKIIYDISMANANNYLGSTLPFLQRS